MGTPLLQWLNFFDPDNGLPTAELSFTIRSGTACVRDKHKHKFTVTENKLNLDFNFTAEINQASGNLSQSPVPH
jgi:hypothetical protein